uniref:Uncharacterized protein n=1 Tax=Sus scrofa TaxID=9823 RepID=A0A4X1VVJ7_PIG
LLSRFLPFHYRMAGPNYIPTNSVGWGILGTVG